MQRQTKEGKTSEQVLRMWSAGKETGMEKNENHKSQYIAVWELLEEVAELLEDLCQSGFDTVHDSTLAGIERAAKQTGQYGMEYLSEQLKHLAEEIAAGRHQMTRNSGELAERYTKSWEYLHLCRQKAAYDRGMDYYSDACKEQP